MQYLVAYFKHLNDYRELTISFLTELFPALLLFIYSLSIIVTSFKFYNLLNMVRDPFNLLLNLLLLKILLSSKPSLLYSYIGGKQTSFYSDPFQVALVGLNYIQIRRITQLKKTLNLISVKVGLVNPYNIRSSFIFLYNYIKI